MLDSYKLITSDNAFDHRGRTTVDHVADGRFISEVAGLPIERLSVYSYKHGLKEEDFIPQAGDQVVVVHLPLGGGNGKSILRFAALSAVTLGVGSVIGAGVTSGLFAASTSLGASAATLGLQIVGSALINNLLPATDQNDAYEQSPTYGIDGAKPTSREGIPVPLCYGKFRHSGNLVGFHVDNVDNRTQFVTTLMCLGEAPIADVTNVYLNDQPIENYNNWAYAVKLIRDVQPNQFGPKYWEILEYADGIEPEDREDVTPSIDSVISPQSVNTPLINDDPDDNADGEGWVTRQTTKTVNKLRIDITAPGGIAYYNKAQKLESYGIEIEAELRQVGTTVWRKFGVDLLETNNVLAYYVYDTADGRNITRSDKLRPNHKVTWSGNTGQIIKQARIVDANRDEFVGEPAENAGTAYRGVYRTNKIELFGKDLAALRFSLTTPFLPEDNYEVRVRRVTPEFVKDDQSYSIADKLVWTDLNEIETEKVGYQGSAMIAVRALLTDQLNAVPQITVEDHGRIISVWNGGPDKAQNWSQENSDNPAWVTWDILTSNLGAQRDPDDLDLLAWKRWADYCEEENLTFRGVFDVNSNVWDAIKQVFRAGRAQIIPEGTGYTVAVEGPSLPVMSFGNGNIIEGSLKFTWEDTATRANEVEVTYYDEEDDYEQRTVKVVDPSQAGQPQRLSSIRVLGVTSQERAMREGTLQLNMNRVIRQTCSFQAPLESIGVSTGDVILVTHDYPLWSYSGRVERYTAPSGGNNATMQLDQPITLEAGRDYAFMIHSPYTFIGNETITQKTANNLSFKVTNDTQIGFIPNLVALYADKDYPITGYTNGWYHVDRPIEAAVNGGSVRLYQTDHLETVDIVHPGVTTELTTIELSTRVHTYDYDHTGLLSRRNFMVGPKESVGKKFRVKKIRAADSENNRTIDCTEYNEGAYEDTELSIVEPTPNLLPSHITVVQNLQLEQSYRLVDGKTIVNVGLTWDYPATGLYEGAEIFGSVNGGEVKSLGRTAGSVAAWEMDFDLDDYVALRVVAYDKIGRSAPFSGSPFEVAYLNETATAGTPANAAAAVDGSKVTLTWEYPAGTTTGRENVEIYRSPTIAFGDATLISELDGPATTWQDQIGPGATVYYFIRFTLTDRVRSLSEFTTPIQASAEGIGGGSQTFTANSDSPPIPSGVGDLWYQPDTGITMRTSDGVNWDQTFDDKYAHLVSLPDPNFNLTASGQTAFWEAIDVNQANVTFNNTGQGGSGAAKIETFSNVAAELKLVSKVYFPSNETEKYHMRMIYTTPNGSVIPNFDFGIRWYDKDKNLLGSTPNFSVTGSGGTGGNWQTLAPNTIVNAQGAWADQVEYIRPYVHAVGNSTTNKEMTISSIEFEKAKDDKGIVDGAINVFQVGTPSSAVYTMAALGSNSIVNLCDSTTLQVPSGLTNHFVEATFNWRAIATDRSVRVQVRMQYNLASEPGVWRDVITGDVSSVAWSTTPADSENIEHLVFATEARQQLAPLVVKVPITEEVASSYTYAVHTPPQGDIDFRCVARLTSAEDWEIQIPISRIDVRLVKK